MSSLETFLFVDHSNFYFGLQQHSRCSPLCIKIHYLLQLWCQNSKPHGWVIGSAMDNSQRDAHYWAKWKLAGLRVLPLSHKKQKELFVDDALHAQMLYTILTNPPTSTNKLVLISGDGNDNENMNDVSKKACHVPVFPNVLN